MTRLRKWIRSRLATKSKDERVAQAIAAFRDLVSIADNRYFCIGSCASLAYSGLAHRLPGDVDFVIGSPAISQLRAECDAQHVKLWERLGFWQSEMGGTKAHVVLDSLKIIDFQKHDIIGEVGLRLPEEWIEERELRLPFGSRAVLIRVPRREVVFALQLLSPPNANTLVDLIQLIGEDSGDAAFLTTFLRSSRTLKDITTTRAETLMKTICRKKPNAGIFAGRKVDRLRSVLSQVSENT